MMQTVQTNSLVKPVIHHHYYILPCLKMMILAEFAAHLVKVIIPPINLILLIIKEKSYRSTQLRRLTIRSAANGFEYLT